MEDTTSLYSRAVRRSQFRVSQKQGTRLKGDLGPFLTINSGVLDEMKRMEKGWSRFGKYGGIECESGKIGKLGLGLGLGEQPIEVSWCDLPQLIWGFLSEFQWIGMGWSQFRGSLGDWGWIWRFRVKLQCRVSDFGSWLLQTGISGGCLLVVGRGWVNDGWWRVVVVRLVAELRGGVVRVSGSWVFFWLFFFCFPCWKWK